MLCFWADRFFGWGVKGRGQNGNVFAGEGEKGDRVGFDLYSGRARPRLGVRISVPGWFYLT